MKRSLKKVDKKQLKTNLDFLNNHIKEHLILMIVLSVVVTLSALFFTIYWNYDENDINEVVDLTYLFGYIFFLVVSFALTVVLVLTKLKVLQGRYLALLTHTYVFLLIGWATAICILDLYIGLTPQFYFLMICVVAGLFIIHPLFFIGCVAASVLSITISSFIYYFAYFNGDYKYENAIIFVAYILFVLLISNIRFATILKDQKYQKRLRELTYSDDLTGLLNERSYLEAIEELDKDFEKGKISKYGVVLMDLNNIKATNDKYGHRFGCHLIVRCGHTLPKYFSSSKVFHVGGDEFIAIILGEDVERMDEILNTMNEELSYSHIEFEGVELIFSVAQGHAKSESGKRYKDILQIADKAMYEHKEYLKTTYNMQKR